MKVYDVMTTGLCDIIICADESKVYSIKIKNPDEEFKEEISSNPITQEVKKQIKEYLLKEREFFDLPLHMDFSSFQKKVYDRIMQIPYGATSTSGKIAVELGEFNYFRSVRGAADKNIFFLVVPCHRVVKDDIYEDEEFFMGKNDEYYLSIKKSLLDIESSIELT